MAYALWALHAKLIVGWALGRAFRSLEGWTGHPLTDPPGPEIVSIRLTRVATFLAAFSGFYFTVAAITDELYRKEPSR